MTRTPSTLWPALVSGDLDGLASHLNPVGLSDMAELMLRDEANDPEAPQLPDEAPPMDQHEWEVRKAMIALTELPEGDHEARARQWEIVAERVTEAADYEWNRAREQG